MDNQKPVYLTVEEYISNMPDEMQDTLRAIRKTILGAAAGATEMIRYHMPSYHLHGKPLIHFALQKKHIAIHPGTETVNVFADKLVDYKCTKGGVHFPLGQPVPYHLITEIVRDKALIVNERKKKKKLLFTRDSECLQPLRALIEKQKHRTLVLWVIDCAPRVLAIFEERYPQEQRPREALEAAKAWARGEIKMPVAKKAAHATHNAATEAEGDSAAQAAARAMGHVVGTVHVETHAIGLVTYGLTAFVYAASPENTQNVIAKECEWFYDRLSYWETNVDKMNRPWAAFLLNDHAPNKEKLLRQKTELKKAILVSKETVK